MANRHAGGTTPHSQRLPREARRGDGPLRASWDPEKRVQSAATSARGGGTSGKGGALRRFVNNWGWRAYAIPVLIIITVAVIADAVRSPSVAETGSSGEIENANPGPIPGADDDPGREVPEMGQLPPGGPVLEAGAGSFYVVPGTSDVIGRDSGELNDFTIEIEDGIDTGDFGGDDAIAQMIEATLYNPKSWTADGKVKFQRVDGDAKPKFRISLSTPETVREACGFDIELETSCYNPDTERVYLNLARWVRGATSFEGDIGLYRQYQINHEVGHAVGHPQHDPCPGEGRLAPIMMQQTLSLKNSDLHSLDPGGYAPDDDVTCRPNAWPFPEV